MGCWLVLHASETRLNFKIICALNMNSNYVVVPCHAIYRLRDQAPTCILFVFVYTHQYNKNMAPDINWNNWLYCCTRWIAWVSVIADLVHCINYLSAPVHSTRYHLKATVMAWHSYITPYSVENRTMRGSYLVWILDTFEISHCVI